MREGTAVEVRERNHASETRRVARRDLSAVSEVLGSSREIQDALETCLQVAHADATVLLLGETGTGKELLARAIHEHSGRRGSYVAINCGAVSESLVESELFGHVKGAFTGASSSKLGLFREADQGTLLLDEVGLLPPHAQHSLLRVLQEGVVRPVGGTQEIRVDVRVIAATSVSLVEAVERGDFRLDLFYRLDVIRVIVPPLRRRGEDVVTLFRAFNERLAARHHVPPLRSSRDFDEALLGYAWPGNVRQLENLTERLLLTHHGKQLEADDFKQVLGLGAEASAAPPRAAPAEVEAGASTPDLSVSLKDYLEQAEEAYLSKALEQTGGHVHRAARLAGLSRRTLSRKIKKFDLQRGKAYDVEVGAPPAPCTWLCAPQLRPCRLGEEATSLTLGRAPTCDFVFPLPGVSRVHARFVRRGTGWAVEDAGSSNGTCLNGEPVRGLLPLKEGDVLEIDALRFEVAISPVAPVEHGTTEPLLRGQLGAVSLETLLSRVSDAAGQASIDVIGPDGSGSLRVVDGEVLWATFTARGGSAQLMGEAALGRLTALTRGMFAVRGNLELSEHDLLPKRRHGLDRGEKTACFNTRDLFARETDVRDLDELRELGDLEDQVVSLDALERTEVSGVEPER